MEALAISPANLDTLEKSMMALNSNLQAVSDDVLNINEKILTYNSEVSSVKENVKTLENDIEKFIKEIKSLTLVSNAQNNILIKNNEQVKKFGQNDSLRNVLKSLLNCIQDQTYNKENVDIINQNSSLVVPDFYINYLIKAIIYWLKNDKLNADKNLSMALKLNKVKTSLILGIFYLKIGRVATSRKWFNYYFKNQKINELDNSFELVMDLLVSDSENGIISEEIIRNLDFLEKNNNNEKNISRWQEFFSKFRNDINFEEYEYLYQYSNDFENIRENVKNARAYYNAFFSFIDLSENKKYNNRNLEKIINDAIFSMETEELNINNDIKLNELIVRYNGDKEKALANMTGENIITNDLDFKTILSNILLSDIGSSKRLNNLAIAYNKDVIKEAMNRTLVTNFELNDIKIKIDDWEGYTKDGSNELELLNSISNYTMNSVETAFGKVSKFDSKLIALLIGIIGGIFACKLNFYLGIAFFIFSIIIGAIYLFDIYNNKKLVNDEYEKRYSYYKNILENVLAEIVDINLELKYKKEDKKFFVDYIDKYNKEEIISID